MTTPATGQTQAEKVRVLLVGADSSIKECLKEISSCEIIEQPADIEKLLEASIDPPPKLILFGLSQPPDPNGQASPTEIAQLLSSQYLGTSVYLVANQNLPIDRKAVIKNGFKDVFLVPIDQSVLDIMLKEFLAQVANGGKVYKAVKLLDVTADTKLEFDTYLYLPANKKHIKYTSAGRSIDKERSEKLKQSQVGSLFIDSQQMKKFYEYTAARLKDMGTDSALSETEREERMRGAVRDLFGSLFSDSASSTETGRGLAAEGQKIVKTYLTEGAQKNWYDRMIAVAASNADSYSHAGNTASYATLFALGLNIKTIEEIAMAALLHDLGLTRVPKEVMQKDPASWKESEKESYQKHIDYTMDIVKEKKLILSDLVRKIIYQHHECYNGTGYPKALSGERICLEAQILAIADRFDDMTAIKEGKPVVTPAQAIQLLNDEISSDPGKMVFNADLLKKILALFPKEMLHKKAS